MAAVLHPRSNTLGASDGPGRVGAIVAVALHAIVAAGLLNYEPARSALASAAPIMVELLAPTHPQPQAERSAEVPRAKPAARLPSKPVEIPPASGTSFVAPSALPPVLERSAQSLALVAALPARAAQPMAPAAPRLAAPMTDPVFNAAYLENPAPAYPALSRRSGEQGKVTLRVLVNPAGRADDVQVRTSSGSPRLDEAARAAVLHWKFVPARRGEEAVAAWVLIPIAFQLED